MENAAKRLIIALDDQDRDSALKMVELTRPYAHTFKVGLALFTAYGPELVRSIQALGVDVFLDLKFHDIPMQVARAVTNALSLKPRFLTVHASGGSAMLHQAAQASAGSFTTVLAVSVLTSLNETDFVTLGFKGTVADAVTSLTELAFSSQVRAFVCSPHEAKILRGKFAADCVLVCPGIRARGSDAPDQSRTMTAKDSIMAGADYLVVGRPITQASHIVEAARAFNREIQEGIFSMNQEQGVTWQ